MRAVSAARAMAAAGTGRCGARAVVVGALCPTDAWRRRRGTPVSSRGVAELGRSVWTDARCVIPLAWRAARKASCTRLRGLGVAAVDMPVPRRPGAGKSHTGWRGGPVCTA